MKHNLKITILILAMFITTQFIGLYVINYYSPIKIVNGVSTNVSAPNLPYGMETPPIQQEKDFYNLFPSIIFAFIIAIIFLFFLTKFKAKFILKAWFFVVVLIALGISFNSFLPQFKYTSILALAIALPLAIFKIYKRDFLIHNLTELFIYPGIAVIFVAFLNIYTIIILLIIISIYDMWAVWHSKIMQKMAKYQMNKLKVFSGFFIPYASKKIKEKIRNLRKTEKGKKELKKKKIKINIAILGGGDITFPMITAGVMLKTGGFWPAVLVIVGAVFGLSYLFFFAKKKKFYPAMPFITTGILINIIFSYLFFRI